MHEGLQSSSQGGSADTVTGDRESPCLECQKQSLLWHISYCNLEASGWIKGWEGIGQSNFSWHSIFSLLLFFSLLHVSHSVLLSFSESCPTPNPPVSTPTRLPSSACTPCSIFLSQAWLAIISPDEGWWAAEGTANATLHFPTTECQLMIVHLEGARDSFIGSCIIHRCPHKLSA